MLPQYRGNNIGEPAGFFLESRFQAHKHIDRGDWFVYDRDHGRPSKDADGGTRFMSMIDARDTAQWLNEAHADNRLGLRRTHPCVI